MIATFYGIHAKRGKEAIDHVEILLRFCGNAIHDHWFPYFSFKQEKEEWAIDMKECRIQAEKLLEDHIENLECVLRLMHNFCVSFTNNQGEQDIRMVKLTQIAILREGSFYVEYEAISQHEGSLVGEYWILLRKLIWEGLEHHPSLHPRFSYSSYLIF